MNVSQLTSFLHEQERLSLKSVMRASSQKDSSGWLPPDTCALFAPRNNTAKPLPKVDVPLNPTERELLFVRNIGLALGIPPTFLMQGGSMCGGSSIGVGGGWGESQSALERCILDGCSPLVRMLEELMSSVYRSIYQSSVTDCPIFRIRADPSIPVEQLMQAYDADLIGDKDVSRIMMSNLGCPLGAEAASARTERRKAANVLPFKDKKVDS